MDFHSLARRDLQFLCKKNRVAANLTNVAMANALDALETVEGIEEIQEALGFQSSKEDGIQETLGFQSLSLKSPELPRTGRRTSVRTAALPSPLYRSRQTLAKDMEVTEMAYKEEKGENKEVPTILSKTPATRKATKGVEARSSKRRANKNQEIEGLTATPMAVEAKGGKAIGVATRRSTRLSSRNALEETDTAQSKSRSSIRENSAVKMEPLAQEDTEEQEKEEQKEDRVEYGDSCAVIVEEHGKKDQEEESNEFSSFSNGENSKNEVEIECEATLEYVPMIQQQQPSQVNTKAQEITKMASEVDDKKKAPKLLLNTRRNTRLSSRNTVEEKSGEQGTVKMVALTEEYAEKQTKQEEKKYLSEKSDSGIVDPVEEDEVKDKKQVSHGNSSSIEVEKCESIVALVEELEEDGKEVEIHGFSSSALAEATNNEVENGDSAVVIVEGDEKNDQELEIQTFSSTIELEKSNAERKNDDSNVVLVEKEGSNDQGESSFFDVHELFESTEDSGGKPRVNNYVKDSRGQSPENEFVEVYSDQAPKTNLVEDSSNQQCEVSGDLLPANDAMEDSCDHSSDAKLAISAVSDSLTCSEMRPLVQEESIVCTQGYIKIDEEEEGKLSMLFTVMTLKELEESDAPLEPVTAHEASFVPTELPTAMAITQYSEIVIAKGECSSPDLPSALDIPPLHYKNVDAIANLGNEISAMEAIRESPEEVKESGIVFPREIAVVSEESIDDDLLDAGELITNGSVNVQDPTIGFPDEVKESSGHLPTEFPELIKESFEDNLMDSSELTANDKIPVSSSELCPEFLTIDSTIELASVDHPRAIPDESFDVPQKTEISQGGSFEQHISVSCAELCSELSTVDSSIEISALIDESVEAHLPNSGELTAENSQQIPVSSTAEIGAAIDAPTISSTPKLPCESESMALEELSIVQTQSSEETGMAATETKTKALEEEVYLKDENLELLSLTKLRAKYKQMMNGSKTQERKKSIIKPENLERLSSIKHDEDCKQKLNDDMIKSESKKFIIKPEDLERLSSIKHDEDCKQKLNDDMIKPESKKSVIKQEDLECRSRGKHDSNKQKLNDDKIKSERKRTPLKSLNYSTF